MADMSNRVEISTATGDFHFIIGGSQDAQHYIDPIIDLYESDYFDPPLKETGLFDPERVRRILLDDYVTEPNFKIVTLWDGDELDGFAYGCSLPPESQWWKDVREPLSGVFIEESGHRTLALLYFVVKKRLRGHGLGRQLHRKFMQGRSEERVTLLCSEPQQPAHSIWQHWGYQKIGTIKPIKRKNKEIMKDVFIRPLPLDTSSDQTAFTG